MGLVQIQLHFHLYDQHVQLLGVHHVFSNFLKFLTIFSEFSITDRVGTRRNDFFYLFIYFISFSAFPHLF